MPTTFNHDILEAFDLFHYKAFPRLCFHESLPNTSAASWLHCHKQALRWRVPLSVLICVLFTYFCTPKHVQRIQIGNENQKRKRKKKKKKNKAINTSNKWSWHLLSNHLSLPHVFVMPAIICQFFNFVCSFPPILFNFIDIVLETHNTVLIITDF